MIVAVCVKLKVLATDVTKHYHHKSKCHCNYRSAAPSLCLALSVYFLFQSRPRLLLTTHTEQSLTSRSEKQLLLSDLLVIRDNSFLRVYSPEGDTKTSNVNGDDTSFTLALFTKHYTTVR